MVLRPVITNYGGIMKVIKILFILSIISCGRQHKEPADTNLVIHKSQIIEGQKTGAGQYLNVIKVKAGNSLCTGTIIHPYLVLTAAHCVNQNPPQIMVELEGYINGWPIAPVRVAKYFYHEDFTVDYDDDKFAENDIAILVLAMPLVLPSSAIIRPLTHDDEFDGDEVTITGFGLNAEEKKSGYKRYKTVDIKGNFLCSSVEGHIRLAESANSGDSGGPSFVQLENGKWKQLGVTSLRMHGRYFGMFCKAASVVDVRNYEEWIFEKVGFHDSLSDLEITEDIKSRFFDQ